LRILFLLSEPFILSLLAGHVPQSFFFRRGESSFLVDPPLSRISHFFYPPPVISFMGFLDAPPHVIVSPIGFGRSTLVVFFTSIICGIFCFFLCKQLIPIRALDSFSPRYTQVGHGPQILDTASPFFPHFNPAPLFFVYFVTPAHFLGVETLLFVTLLSLCLLCATPIEWAVLTPR